MIKNKLLNFLSVLIISCTYHQHIVGKTSQHKIVALVPGHNDARFMFNCFRALACYVDAIVYLDDASTDNSIAVALELANECYVECIIIKGKWIRDAAADRQRLLEAGRAIGGTHFVTLDMDEFFSANCLPWLRDCILRLKPGEQLCMCWIQLWRSLNEYRYDSSVWTHNYKQFAFCDDGKCSYTPAFLNESRTPNTLSGTRWVIQGYEYGVVHLQFVNFENLLRKQAWYRCMERVYNPNRTIESINSEYSPSKDEQGLATLSAPKEWFAYEFFDPSMVCIKETWREKETMEWFKTYGLRLFAGLEIWDTQWPFEAYREQDSSFLDKFVFCKKQDVNYVEIGTPANKNNDPTHFLKCKRGWHALTDNMTREFPEWIVIHVDNECAQQYLDSTLDKNIQVITVDETLVTDAMKMQLQEQQFAYIPYTDNGYTHFIRMHTI